MLSAADKFGEAEQLQKDALGDARSLLGDGNPTTIAVARGLAAVIEHQGRFADALAMRRDELARTVKARGADDVYAAAGLTGPWPELLVQRPADDG